MSPEQAQKLQQAQLEAEIRERQRVLATFVLFYMRTKLIGRSPEEDNMGLAESKQQLFTDMDSAVSSFYQAAVNDGLAQAGAPPQAGPSQADLDAANAHVASLSAQVDALTSQDQLDQEAAKSLQSKLDAISAILNPAPAASAPVDQPAST